MSGSTLWFNSVCYSVVSYLAINNLRYQTYTYHSANQVTAYVTSLICYLSVLKNVNNNLLIHLKPSEVLARNPKCTCTMYVLFIWKPENNMIKVISRWHICFIGFGDSTGFPSEDGCVADSYFLYKWVRKRSAQVPVIIWGHSLGTG